MPVKPEDLPAPGAPLPAARPGPQPGAPPGPRAWPDEPSPYPARPAPPAAAPRAAAPPPPPAQVPEGDAPPRPLLDRVIDALRTCYDPEIPLNIYDLSLIYAVDVDPAGRVSIQMTLTSPTCPVAGTLPGEVQQKVAAVPGVSSAQVDLVWDPPWEPSRLSEAARLQLGLL